MAFSATVQGIGSFAGTVEGQTAFLASMAAMGPKGDKGDTGATGATGATGPQGPQGNPGAAATVNAGTTTTGAAGSFASVVNAGTTSAAVFNFTIPRGDKGEQGIQGIKGDTGETGPQGPKGDTGDTGVVAATAPLAYNSGTKTVSIDLSAYATQSFVTSQGYITSSALTPYLTSATAASTYQTISGMSSYLTTSAAATTYYPIPTGTTSQYLRGNGTLSTFSTDVIAAVPAASETTAGKVELATEAEAIAGTSTTLAVTPSTLDIVASSPARLAIGAAVFSSGTSGTGAGFAANTGTNQRQVTAPTTATGYATGVYSFLARPTNAYNSAIDWSKRNEFDFLLIKGVTTSDANTVGRVVIGKPSFASVAGDPTTRTVGVRFYGNGNLQLIVNDGTSLTATSTSISMSSVTSLVLRIVSEGNGTVRLFSGGTEVATTTSGPTVSTGSSNAMYMEAQNLATISTQGMTFLVGNFTATFGY